MKISLQELSRVTPAGKALALGGAGFTVFGLHSLINAVVAPSNIFEMSNAAGVIAGPFIVSIGVQRKNPEKGADRPRVTAGDIGQVFVVSAVALLAGTSSAVVATRPHEMWGVAQDAWAALTFIGYGLTSLWQVGMAARPLRVLNPRATPDPNP